MKINYWLLKSEPSTWSWEDQVKARVDMRDGVRNYQARNNLISMKKKDLCFFYHSVSEKSIVGIVEVVKEHYPDPTDNSKPRWRTGKRAFRLTSNSTNSLTGDVFTSAETDYTAKGLIQQVQATVTSTREAQITRTTQQESTTISSVK